MNPLLDEVPGGATLDIDRPFLPRPSFEVIRALVDRGMAARADFTTHAA
jgi:hypothetical protein